MSSFCPISLSTQLFKQFIYYFNIPSMLACYLDLILNDLTKSSRYDFPNHKILQKFQISLIWKLGVQNPHFWCYYHKIFNRPVKLSEPRLFHKILIFQIFFGAQGSFLLKNFHKFLTFSTYAKFFRKFFPLWLDILSLFLLQENTSGLLKTIILKFLQYGVYQKWFAFI